MAERAQGRGTGGGGGGGGRQGEPKQNVATSWKPPRKSLLGRLVKLVFLVAFVGSIFLLGNYSTKIDRKPWDWTGDDWRGFLGFAREETEAAGREIQERLPDDWSAELAAFRDRAYDALPENVKNISLSDWMSTARERVGDAARYAEERFGDSEAGSGGEGGSTAARATDTATGTRTAARTQASEYERVYGDDAPRVERGIQRFRQALARYRLSIDGRGDDADIRESMRLFHDAQEELSPVADRYPDDPLLCGDEGVMVKLQQFLQDCVKRSRVGG